MLQTAEDVFPTLEMYEVDFNGFKIKVYKNQAMPEHSVMLSSDLYEDVLNFFKSKINDNHNYLKPYYEE